MTGPHTVLIVVKAAETIWLWRDQSCEIRFYVLIEIVLNATNIIKINEFSNTVKKGD